MVGKAETQFGLCLPYIPHLLHEITYNYITLGVSHWDLYTHFLLFLSSELCPIPSDFGRTHHILY